MIKYAFSCPHFTNVQTNGLFSFPIVDEFHQNGCFIVSFLCSIRHKCLCTFRIVFHPMSKCTAFGKHHHEPHSLQESTLPLPRLCPHHLRTAASLPALSFLPCLLVPSAPLNLSHFVPLCLVCASSACDL